METYKYKVVNLLSKFGTAVSILQYFGYHHQVMWTMVNLWSKTKTWWNSLTEAFGNAIEKQRIPLWYTKGLDQEFIDILFKNKNYMKYSISIFINLRESQVWVIGRNFKFSVDTTDLNIFNEFISKVKEVPDIEINRVFVYTNNTMIYINLK